MNGTDLVAVAIHEIDQGAKVTADDVTSASRTSPDELAYDQVVGKKATRDISPNEIVKKGSVSKT